MTAARAALPHAAGVRLLPRRAPADLRVVQEAPVVPRRHYEAVVHDDRTDLLCTVCTRVMAYAVDPERLERDGAFFVEQHRPFCGSR